MMVCCEREFLYRSQATKFRVVETPFMAQTSKPPDKREVLKKTYTLRRVARNIYRSIGKKSLLPVVKRLESFGPVAGHRHLIGLTYGKVIFMAGKEQRQIYKFIVNLSTVCLILKHVYIGVNIWCIYL
jgi:hypothetical protein